MLVPLIEPPCCHITLAMGPALTLPKSKTHIHNSIMLYFTLPKSKTYKHNNIILYLVLQIMVILALVLINTLKTSPNGASPHFKHNQLFERGLIIRSEEVGSCKLIHLLEIVSVHWLPRAVTTQLNLPLDLPYPWCSPCGCTTTVYFPWECSH